MQNTIHFLISHSISLYCQTEREGLQGTDRDVVVVGGMCVSRVHVFVWAEGGKQRSVVDGWMDVEFKKRGGKRVVLASQVAHHFALASSAVTG